MPCSIFSNEYFVFPDILHLLEVLGIFLCIAPPDADMEVEPSASNDPLAYGSKVSNQHQPSSFW